MQDQIIKICYVSVFDVEFERIQKDVFWGDKLDNLSDKLFKA